MTDVQPVRRRWYPRLIRREQAVCHACRSWSPTPGALPTTWAWHDPTRDLLMCPSCAGTHLPIPDA